MTFCGVAKENKPAPSVFGKIELGMVLVDDSARDV